MERNWLFGELEVWFFFGSQDLCKRSWNHVRFLEQLQDFTLKENIGHDGEEAVKCIANVKCNMFALF